MGHEPFWGTPGPLEPSPYPSARVAILSLLGCPKRAGWLILGSEPLLPPALSRGTGRCDLQALAPGSVELAAGSFGPHGHLLISWVSLFQASLL